MITTKWTADCGGPAARSTHRIFGSLLAAAAAVSALTGYHGSATGLRRDTFSYSVRGHVVTLVVTAPLGDVQVTGASTRTVSVTQHLVFHGPPPTTRHRLAAGVLSLTSHCAASEFCRVSYDIAVPSATAVRVTDELGAVRISALAGQVKVTVDAGQIDLSSLSGPVEATARAGSIAGQRISSPRADLRASAGAIDVTFTAVPTAITATTDIGTVILRVPNSVPYHVNATATAGHIAVTVTQNTAAFRTITASTKLGSITIEP